MHNPVTTAGAFALLILIVGGAFAYVSANPLQIELKESPYMGIDGTNVTPDNAEELGTDATSGIFITSVADNSPAEESGLRIGDVIIRADGEEIRNRDDMLRILSQKFAGDSIVLAIIRGASNQEVSMVLGRLPEG